MKIDRHSRRVKGILALLICLLTMHAFAQQAFDGPLSEFKKFPKGAVYQNPDLPATERVNDIIKHLTFDEALSLTGGWNYLFFPGVPRLGLRNVFMTNASQGVNLRPAYTNEKISTSFPCALALATTWNPELAWEMGQAIGKECRVCGVDALFGPGLNMQRFSVSGRNYEYYGEDPVLTSRFGVEFIKGLQSENVMATAKHFIGNDQEFCRHITNSIIDERTLREIYLPPWKAVVQEADVKAVMGGNNQINGTPNAMDKQMLNDVLREEFGFTGMSMTDWQNTSYYPETQYLFPNSGMSLLMPTNETFANYLKSYLKENPEEKDEIRQLINKKVFQNLLPLFEMGAYDREVKDESLRLKMVENKRIALKVAEEAICMLKNQDSILPISTDKKILLMGASEPHCGRGSGFVDGYDHVDFADGLRKVYGDHLLIVEDPKEEQIKKADIVLYRLTKEAGEGMDIPFEVGFDHYVSRTAALNPNVIVLINSSNPMPMPWINEVKGILWCNFLGQERGNALANVLSGKISPSGKLPFTIEKDFQDSQDPEFNYLGGKPYWFGNNHYYKKYWLGQDPDGANEHFRTMVKPHQIIPVEYKEGIFMGYRWYDKQNIEVHFPFGFGLSYTKFDFRNIRLSKYSLNENDSLVVSLEITNVGECTGAEVVQLYLSDPVCSVERPEKELKYFKKVNLQPGESKSIDFVIKPQDLAFWDVKQHDWEVESGAFEVLIGSSSRNIHLKEKFNVE